MWVWVGGLFPFFVVACVVKEPSDKVGLTEQNYILKESGKVWKRM